MLTCFQGTPETFDRTGYFGGVRTVPWSNQLDEDTGMDELGYNESGANLVFNLSGLRTEKARKLKIEKVYSSGKMSEKLGTRYYKRTRR